MKDWMMKKTIFMIFVFAVAFAGSIFLISGCETIGAIRSGDLKTEDVMRMANTHEARVEDTGEGEKAGDTRPIELIKGLIKKADNWFRDNLW